MAFQASKLISEFDSLIVEANKAEAVTFARIDSVDTCQADSLIFVEDESQLPKELPAVVITHKNVADRMTELTCCVIVVNNVRLAQAHIKQHYQDYDSADMEWGAVHDTATVHASAKLGKGVRLGPNVVIGKDVSIGQNTHIRSNAVVEHGAVIGRDCIINSMVNIGYNCQLGDRVNVHTGVVIGNEGFGFAQDHQRDFHRIPHTGNVVIGNDVQIGANSNIDRATYESTIIGNGVKLDSLCHIAHNVHIDEHTLFASQACIAGSTYVGKRVMSSGQVGILDHLRVADNAVLVHRTGVTENIESSGMYAGVPAKPFKEYVRGLGANKRIDKLNRQLKDLKQELQQRFGK